MKHNPFFEKEKYKNELQNLKIEINQYKNDLLVTKT